MLSKCSNPSCSNPFLYLRDGRLFQMEIEESGSEPAQLADESAISSPGKRSSRRLEFFWLCGTCSSTLSLAYKRGVGVKVVPLRSTPQAAAA